MSPGPNVGVPLLLWGILALAMAAAVAFVLFIYRPDGPARGGVSYLAEARLTGKRCDYTIEKPAGWKRVDPGSLGAVAPPDLDLALFEDDDGATVFVLIEEVPADLVLASDNYFEAIVRMMKKNGPGTVFLEDGPLPQDPDNGALVRVQMPDERGAREGYVATLLTPRWAFRIVATAPTRDFPAHKKDLLSILSSLTPPPGSVPLHTSFEEARRAPTRLVRHGPSPQAYEKEPLPKGVEKVVFESGPLSLEGYFVPPRGAPSGKVPGLVYLHGGFAFDNGDLEVPGLFAEAGFAAFAPTYRGENGNPGEYEMFRGELDDAAAAVRWLAARSDVDTASIHVFGHSAGGGLAALVALLPDVPVASTGSAGGVYDEETFDGWQKAGMVPFDALDRAERRVRVLGPFLREIRRPHYVYAGEQDAGATAAARVLAGRARRLGRPVHVEALPGDRGSSLLPAAKMFLARLKAP